MFVIFGIGGCGYDFDDNFVGTGGGNWRFNYGGPLFEEWMYDYLLHVDMLVLDHVASSLLVGWSVEIRIENEEFANV